MKLTNRISELREQSLEAVETLSAERAQLVTRFYASDESKELPAPIKRGIQVILPYDCKEGTSVHIYSDRGQLVKTLTGAFDTGCTLPCPARYKVVPVHPQKKIIMQK